MHFLITNDDGYGAPGILALEQALLPLGKVTVVAPLEHLSGCSHQVTNDRNLEIRRYEADRYAVDGLPADCARLGILHLATDCDWVVSGINAGANVGCDLYYSGTVAGAREARLMGKPAIAVSHYHLVNQPLDWEQAALRTRAIVQALLKERVPPNALWNVNLPTSEHLGEDTPVRRCGIDPHPLDVAYYLENGVAHYRHGRYHHRPRNEGTDVDVCFGGAIAISEVPLYG